MKLRIPPPILTLLAATAMWVLDRWLPLAHLISSPWNRLGALPAAIGLAIIVAALLRFRRAQTTVDPRNPAKATQIVTGGVFRLSRNPMYLGLLFLLVGWAIWLHSASPWLIPPLFVLLITRVQIIYEEKALEQLFGAKYVEYRQTVPRWIGRRG